MKKEQFSLLKYIPSFHYEVPDCPCCGSNKTGRYIKAAPISENSDDWMILNAVKSGEYVKPVHIVPDHNCFCMSCGFEWAQDIPLKIISRYRRNLIKKEKGLNALENEIIGEKKNERKNDKGALKGIKHFISSL